MSERPSDMAERQWLFFVDDMISFVEKVLSPYQRPRQDRF